MDQGQAGLRKLLRFLVQRRQHTILTQPCPEIGKLDLGPFAQEGTGDLEGQGQPAQQPAYCLGLAVFGMSGVEDSLAVRVAEEQLQRRVLRQHLDLDRRKAVQVAPSGGKEHPAGQVCWYQILDHRTVEVGRFGHVVKDQQGPGVLAQVVPSNANPLIPRAIGSLWLQFLAQISKSLGQRVDGSLGLGGGDPEDAIGVGVSKAVGILDGHLGFPDAAHSAQSDWANSPGSSALTRCRVLPGQGLVQALQILFTPYEVRIPYKGNDEMLLGDRLHLVHCLTDHGLQVSPRVGVSDPLLLVAEQGKFLVGSKESRGSDAGPGIHF